MKILFLLFPFIFSSQLFAKVYKARYIVTLISKKDLVSCSSTSYDDLSKIFYNVQRVNNEGDPYFSALTGSMLQLTCEDVKEKNENYDYIIGWGVLYIEYENPGDLPRYLEVLSSTYDYKFHKDFSIIPVN